MGHSRTVAPVEPSRRQAPALASWSCCDTTTSSPAPSVAAKAWARTYVFCEVEGPKCTSDVATFRYSAKPAYASSIAAPAAWEAG